MYTSPAWQKAAGEALLGRIIAQFESKQGRSIRLDSNRVSNGVRQCVTNPIRGRYHDQIEIQPHSLLPNRRASTRLPSYLTFPFRMFAEPCISGCRQYRAGRAGRRRPNVIFHKHSPPISNIIPHPLGPTSRLSHGYKKRIMIPRFSSGTRACSQTPRAAPATHCCTAPHVSFAIPSADLATVRSAARTREGQAIIRNRVIAAKRKKEPASFS